MHDWDELRTAYEVARHGTVSGAAAVLGVHHATVIRHVDALEARLGVKLFQRHARGYTATDAGEELARVAGASADQFAQLEARLSGQGEEVSGELVLTTLAGLVPQLMPALAGFRDAHPGLRLKLVTGRRLFRLEYGEAHVAIRAGRAPSEPDNVVQPLIQLDTALYVAPSYIARRGDPRETGFGGHDFVAPEAARPGPPTLDWFEENVGDEQFALRSNDEVALRTAVTAGLGLGFLPVDDAAGLVQVLPAQDAWRAELWLVTHVDLHRSAKVQALTGYLKTALAG